MSKFSYTKCQYESADTKVECDVWYSSEEDQKFCILHRNTINASLAAAGINKESYIEHRDKKAKFCYEMSLDELDKHISEIERIIELEKSNLMTARAVRADKIEKLTDDEREVRRRIKTPKAIQAPLTAKGKAIEDLMKKLKINKETAIMMLEDD